MSEDEAMTDDEGGAAAPVALRVIKGSASAEETAAVVVALAAVRSAPEGGEAPSGPAAWTLAARLEGVGARLVTSRADLTGL